jgi:hypothetical protein
LLSMPNSLSKVYQTNLQELQISNKNFHLVYGVKVAKSPATAFKKCWCVSIIPCECNQFDSVPKWSH